MEEKHEEDSAQDDNPAVHTIGLPPDIERGTCSAPSSPHRSGFNPDTDEATNSTPNSPLLGGSREQSEGASSTQDLPLLSLCTQNEFNVGQPPGLFHPVPSTSSQPVPGPYSGNSSLTNSPVIGLRVISQSVLALGMSTSLLDTKSDSCSLVLPPCTALLPPDSKSDTNSAMLPFCRICHSPEEENNNLISPCRCSGTLQFIHQSCLMKWLEISSRKSRKPPRCELCHFQFIKHKKFRFSHWRFPRVSRQDKILHVVFLINLVIMIGCAIATVMCFLSDKGQISKFGPHRNKADLTSEEITTLSCGVLFFVSFFIAMAVQIKAKHTVYQLFVKCIMQNMEWEIDEYDQAKDNAIKPAPASV